MDAVIQPLVTGAVEVALWAAIFASTQKALLAGFSRESYLAYALWSAFIARISANWMYEFRMIEEIDTGSVNSVLARPISFYEYYLSQFMGYKLLTSLVSLAIPFTITLFFIGGTHHERFPLALALSIYYLFFVYSISFAICSFAFFFNRIHAFTVAKNFALWIVTGELFPLDLVPDPLGSWLIALPFSSAVFVPVGYLTGRLGLYDVGMGFVSVTIGHAILGVFCYFLWSAGRRRYSGTGA